MGVIDIVEICFESRPILGRIIEPIFYVNTQSLIFVSSKSEELKFSIARKCDLQLLLALYPHSLAFEAVGSRTKLPGHRGVTSLLIFLRNVSHP